MSDHKAMPPTTELPERNQAPSVVGRRVALRPVTPRDYEYLYGLAADPRFSFRWRLRGTTPDPRAFEAMLWEQILVQFLVVETNTSRAVGLVSCLSADLRSGVANLATLIDSDATGLGAAGDALALFVDYVFALWNFRVLYAETPEFNFGQFAFGSELFFTIEARVRDRYWHNGRYWDNVIIALTRERWEEIGPRLMRAVRDAH